MSLKENETWVEHCYQNFQEYLEAGNYEMCKNAIADMFDVSPNTAREMNDELRNVPIERFAIKSPWPLI